MKEVDEKEVMKQEEEKVTLGLQWLFRIELGKPFDWWVITGAKNWCRRLIIYMKNMFKTYDVTLISIENEAQKSYNKIVFK